MCASELLDSQCHEGNSSHSSVFLVRRTNIAEASTHQNAARHDNQNCLQRSFGLQVLQSTTGRTGVWRHHTCEVTNARTPACHSSAIAAIAAFNMAFKQTYRLHACQVYDGQMGCTHIRPQTLDPHAYTGIQLAALCNLVCCQLPYLRQGLLTFHISIALRRSPLLL